MSTSNQPSHAAPLAPPADPVDAEFLALFPRLCIPRKVHHCRICDERIAVGEPCCRWKFLEPGERYGTSHAHPECYKHTIRGNWDEGDWESTMPGDVSRKEVREAARP